MAWQTSAYIAWLMIGTLSFLTLLLLIVMFGKIIKLQLKVWFLAKRGYHLVEHIGTDRVRRYFYLKPRDNKFDFTKGFYLHIPETTTKAGKILDEIPKALKLKKLKNVEEDEYNRAIELKSKIILDLKKCEPGTDDYDKLVGILHKVQTRLKDLDVDKEEYEKLEKSINQLTYSVDAVTLRWGIPTITYVGNDPNPILFTQREKVYGAQVIRDVYLRLLATQKYDDFRKWLMIGCAVIGLTAVVFVIYFFLLQGGSENLEGCMSAWKGASDQLGNCLNRTAKAIIQNSTITI